MKRAAVFFDRDNTLLVSAGYLGDPAGVVLMDGAADAIAQARQMGYAVVVFSNQSAVARGIFTEEDVRAVNAQMERKLRHANPLAIIDGQQFCPYHPQAPLQQYRRDSDLRKPRPGMILEAARLLDLDLSRSWVIGDAPRDIQAGKAAGCQTILLQHPKLNPSPAAAELSDVSAEWVVNTLPEAMDIIHRQHPLPDYHPKR
jgi:D-glycero-D-manno-heptose 1,7-bisphosphate phosphatase